MGLEEQAEEVECLQSIYPDLLTVVSDTMVTLPVAAEVGEFNGVSYDGLASRATNPPPPQPTRPPQPRCGSPSPSRRSTPTSRRASSCRSPGGWRRTRLTE